jgi:crotonobetainyl-CoA:carnitine CoA-transferase CaiB-like acyl-CoA transferase
VLDLSAYIAGPYGCTLLADQGADGGPIKIEPPDGDNLRPTAAVPVHAGSAESRAFIGVNRSKYGIVLDLKQPADLAAADAPGARGRRAGAQLPARCRRAWASTTSSCA